MYLYSLISHMVEASSFSELVIESDPSQGFIGYMGS